MSSLSALTTRRKSVVEVLRTEILTGAIAPGQRVIEGELAERMGVSRIPIREALRTLQAEGLVVIEPKRGTICRALQPKDLNDLYALRVALERLAVRLAAEQFVDLREFTKERRAAAVRATMQGDLARLIALDREFHAALAEGAGNEHLTAALESCWSQVMRGMHFYSTITAYREDVWAEHLAIAQAVAGGDAELAEQRIGAHIGHSRTSILEGLRREER